MLTPAASTIWLCTATESARHTLRALAMALRAPPADLPLKAGAQADDPRGVLARLHHALLAQPRSVAIVDISTVTQAAPHLLSLAQQLPDARARARVLLLREFSGLWGTDQAWAADLGFAGLWAQVDAAELVREGHPLVAAIARGVERPSLPPQALQQYFSAMRVGLDGASPRHRIRAATGLDAEALCLALASEVKHTDRSYLLKIYPACHTGVEAVDWLTGRFRLDRPQAVEVGRDLQRLGLLQHVVHEQPFADLPNFYRPTHSTALDRWNLAAVYPLLVQPSGLEVRDRSYLGKTYERCFVGADAVQWVAHRLRLRRHEAEILLNRLMAFGLIEHVTREHPVRDGHFFYRFTA